MTSTTTSAFKRQQRRSTHSLPHACLTRPTTKAVPFTYSPEHKKKTKREHRTNKYLANYPVAAATVNSACGVVGADGEHPAGADGHAGAEHLGIDPFGGMAPIADGGQRTGPKRATKTTALGYGSGRRERESAISPGFGAALANHV